MGLARDDDQTGPFAQPTGAEQALDELCMTEEVDVEHAVEPRW